MAIWHVLLYTVGTALALRSLVSLMAHHKQNYERRRRKQIQKATGPGSPVEKSEQEAPGTQAA